MRNLLHDIKIALRLMARSRAFTAAALLTIALAVGANTAIFSLAYGVLWRPLPYPHAERLVRLSEVHPGGVSPLNAALLSNLTYDAWESSAKTLDAFGAYDDRAFTIDAGAAVERIRGTSVTPSLFGILGAASLHGRVFDQEDAVANSAPVAVLGHSYWRRRFGGDPGVVGRTLHLDGVATQVVGVAPAGFSFPDPETSVYTPFVVDRPESADPDRVGVMFAIGRLAPGATAAQAAFEGTAAARSNRRPLAAEMLFGKGGAVEVRVRGIAEEATLAVRPALLVLVAGVGLLLLVACANGANLFLARAAGRDRELAVRAALGAGRRRLFRQLLTESLTLALAGGALGALLAWALIQIVPALAPDDLPRLEGVALDGTALAVALAASITAGVLAGLLPALRGARVGLNAAMREGDPRSLTGGGARARTVLLGLEAALAVVLLVGAALVGRSFAKLIDVEAGYDPTNVLIGEIFLTGAANPEARAAQFTGEFLERVRGLPGVEAAGIGNMAPFANAFYLSGFSIPGSAGPDGQPVIASASQFSVTPGYAEALGLHLRQGRLLAADDASAPSIALLVNEKFVRDYLTDGRPVVGRRWDDFADGRTAEIVGVIGDVKPALDGEARAEYYRAIAPDQGYPYMHFVVRTAGDPQAVSAAIQNLVRALEPAAALDRVGPLTARVSHSVGRPRFAAAVLIAFAIYGLALAATGLYGALSYQVSTRRRELGVRAALGAERRDLIALILRQGMAVTSIGLVAGLATAALLTRLMQKLLFGIQALDPVSFVLAPALLLLVALAACALPARRAARVQPAEALRAE